MREQQQLEEALWEKNADDGEFLAGAVPRDRRPRGLRLRPSSGSCPEAGPYQPSSSRPNSQGSKPGASDSPPGSRSGGRCSSHSYAGDGSPQPATQRRRPSLAACHRPIPRRHAPHCGSPYQLSSCSSAGEHRVSCPLRRHTAGDERATVSAVPWIRRSTIELDLRRGVSTPGCCRVFRDVVDLLLRIPYATARTWPIGDPTRADFLSLFYTHSSSASLT